MKYVWTVAGDDPDFAVGDRHGIDGYFYPMNDSVTTPEQVALTAAHGGGRAIGIYMGHNWFPGLSPAQLAAVANEEYKRVTKNGTINKTLKVMFNLEDHDPGAIAATLGAWRVLRRNVGTSWSMEGMQGGWMSDEFVAAILALKVRVVPQAFVADMARRESDMVLRDLTRRGFPETSVSLFLDAANLGVGWEGWAFTAGRLP